MNKIIVFNIMDSKLDEISPQLCKSLIEKGYAEKHKVLGLFGGKIKDVYGIRVDVLLPREFEELKKKVKNEMIKTHCWTCSKEIEVKTLSKRSFCSECISKYKTEYEKELELYLRYRAKFMLNRAMRILENQKCTINMLDYKEPHEVINEAIEKDYNKFDSAHEMAAAMELIRNRIHVKTHPKIANHKPDFMLRDLKTILEIDGYMHKTSLEKDFKFDIDMRKELGPEWEVIRISTEYIEKNIIKLVEAIKELKRYKQKIRKENGGVLPQWFSARDKKAWNALNI